MRQVSPIRSSERRPNRFLVKRSGLSKKEPLDSTFVGDLNDKYWTSHVAVYLPRGNERWFADVESFELVKASGEGNKNTKHSQRKILEAQWFAKATKVIADETRRVLDYVADVSGEDVSTQTCTSNPRKTDKIAGQRILQLEPIRQLRQDI
jgi:hypothetical protein